VIIRGCLNPGSHPRPESSESLSAYADLQADGLHSSDVDWDAAEFDCIFEQTMGSVRSF
jgi:hypothetical protein